MEDPITIEYYEADNGRCPFLEWQNILTQQVRDLVTVRLARVRLGNFGDCKAIEGERGLYELRIHMSPGLRIYFGKRGKTVVILLCGGDKGSQKRDISRAKKYWNDC
jgi:putative addiction module killer protein